ncbi:hypothetical protein HNR23_001312 [Nocardiopsis mwathae]|uniref:Uncharacterized protein n=1 Tax=Nocardiopsis mwathae TaxID=1472723 RepID=A0A7W9YFQ4_9ACTN|nr:hypothetical protein [Nocardiopsis mwathae]MBB6171252.1 hypothetical protein [Nocardiopsis mwathae]
MGISVFTEDQIHQREYAGPELSSATERIFDAATEGTFLSGIHLHADTMFNTWQLTCILEELDSIALRRPEISTDIANVKSLIETIIRKRGYLWISGD